MPTAVVESMVSEEEEQREPESHEVARVGRGVPGLAEMRLGEVIERGHVGLAHFVSYRFAWCPVWSRMLGGLFEDVEVFAGFEADRFAGGDGDFGAGAGVSADAGFAGLDGEDAESAELDAVAFGRGTASWIRRWRRRRLRP